MGKVEIRIPLVTWRDGRPRFIPGPSTAALGYKGEDLRHGKKGAWFTVEECLTWSERRVRELEERRGAIAAGVTTQRKVVAQVKRARAAGIVSIGEVLTAFRDLNPRMLGVSVVEGRRQRKPLADSTTRGYRGSIRLLERFDDGEVWAAPADDLTPAALSGILERFEIKHGLAQTRALRAMLSTAFGWAMTRQGKQIASRNPVADLEETLPVMEPRVRYGTVEEMEHFVSVCDALGFADIGDAIMTGLYTAQRQADRLALVDTQFTPEGVIFRQSKKGGQPLLIPLIDVFKPRVEAALQRRKEWRLNHGEFLIDERLRKPWDDHGYRKVFRVLRHAAAFGTMEAVNGKPTPMGLRLFGKTNVTAKLDAAGLAPMASLADFRDQDLRDTAVTWLTLAGCTKWEVASITGHSLKSIDGILSHYFGMHPDLARSGMAKLQAWRASK